MRKICALLLAAVLPAVPAARAETVVARVGWEKAQAVLAQDDFLPTIRVELQSGKRLKGKLIGMTDEALRIERKKAETAIVREDIRSVRLVPRKASRQKNRALALAGGAAVGFGGGLLAGAACCGTADELTTSPAVAWAAFFGTWAAIQFLTYRIGLRADRGAVLLELTEAAADSSPPVPAGRPAPEKEKQPLYAAAPIAIR